MRSLAKGEEAALDTLVVSKLLTAWLSPHTFGSQNHPKANIPKLTSPHTLSWRASRALLCSQRGHVTSTRPNPEAGSYLRRIDFCITQLKAQSPSRTCNESQKGERKTCPRCERCLTPAQRVRGCQLWDVNVWMVLIAKRVRGEPRVEQLAHDKDIQHSLLPLCKTVQVPPLPARSVLPPT